MTEHDEDHVDHIDENANLIDDREEATLGMSEIDGFDFERAAMLMSIIEKVANVAPKSTSISGIAQAALNEMNEEAKAIAKRRADEFKKLEAEARAKQAKEQRARELAAQDEEKAQRERADAEVRVPRTIPSQPTPQPSRQPFDPSKQPMPGHDPNTGRRL